MVKGVEVVDLGWDLTIRIKSRRSIVMNSIWLKGEGGGEVKGNGSY